MISTVVQGQAQINQSEAAPASEKKVKWNGLDVNSFFSKACNNEYCVFFYSCCNEVISMPSVQSMLGYDPPDPHRKKIPLNTRINASSLLQQARYLFTREMMWLRKSLRMRIIWVEIEVSLFVFEFFFFFCSSRLTLSRHNETDALQPVLIIIFLVLYAMIILYKPVIRLVWI